MKKNDSATVGVRFKRAQLVKVKGNPPPDLLEQPIDPADPPDCVLEIIEIDANNEKTLTYRRGL